MSILCIGEMLIDFTPVSGMKNTYTANPGGAPANVAVSAARNGIKAGFLGKLGNDDFGRLLINTLKNDNVDILLPELTDEATTTLAFVSLDEKGDRSFTFARKPGADMLLSIPDVQKVDFSAWDIIHAGSVSQSGSPEKDAVLLALKKAKEAGKLVSFDINFRDKIWGFEECKSEVLKVFPYVDLLKISEEELDFVGGRDNIPAFMKEYDIAVTVLTLGGDGAAVYYMGDKSAITIPAMKVKCTDTTGAGDAYWGGFLSSLIRQGVKKVSDIDQAKLETAGRYGAVSGGLCIQKPGGIPALPTVQEIEGIISATE
ncbi:MAG: carbohydrate kinase [Lachnospiraceae bacterium]|nr:carbohydrate kinase [Lachnospiraceae bacterium]